MSAVLLIAEFDANGLKTATRQAVRAAHSWKLPVDVLVLGTANPAALEQAQKLSGVRKVLHANAAHLTHASAEDASKLLQSIAADYSVVLAPHTSQGKNILPRFAALQGRRHGQRSAGNQHAAQLRAPHLRRQPARHCREQAWPASVDRARLALEGCGAGWRRRTGADHRTGDRQPRPFCLG